MGIHVHPRLKRWVFWTGVAAFLLISLQLSALAFPQPWFSHQARYGNLTFYADAEINPEHEAAMREVAARLKPVELRDSTAHLRVFMASDPELYALFARLAFVPPVVPGFNLSVLDNSFISVAGLHERNEWYGGTLPYSAREGDLAQCIAHEVMHDYMVGESGFIRSLRLPGWKKEGYAEYGASLAFIQADTTVTLSERIHIMQTRSMADGAREYYGWGLVVEFLCEKRDYDHAAVMADSVTLESAYTQMMEWYRTQAR